MIGTPVPFSNSSGSGTGSAVSGTLPTITTEGLVVLWHTVNNTSGTLSGTTAGYVAATGSPAQHSTTMQCWCWTKPVSTADSGAGFSTTMSASGEWALGGIYVPGAYGSPDAQATPLVDTTADTAADFPGITPVGNDDLLVGVGSGRHAFATPTGGLGTLTQSFIEQVDVVTTSAASPNLSVVGITKQLAGQAGAAQTAPSGTWAVSSSDCLFMLALAPLILGLPAARGPNYRR